MMKKENILQTRPIKIPAGMISETFVSHEILISTKGCKARLKNCAICQSVALKKAFLCWISEGRFYHIDFPPFVCFFYLLLLQLFSTPFLSDFHEPHRKVFPHLYNKNPPFKTLLLVKNHQFKKSCDKILRKNIYYRGYPWPEFRQKGTLKKCPNKRTKKKDFVQGTFIIDDDQGRI